MFIRQGESNSSFLKSLFQQQMYNKCKMMLVVFYLKVLKQKLFSLGLTNLMIFLCLSRYLSRGDSRTA